MNKEQSFLKVPKWKLLLKVGGCRKRLDVMLAIGNPPEGGLPDAEDTVKKCLKLLTAYRLYVRYGKREPIARRTMDGMVY